jgi:hypothetical protein
MMSLAAARRANAGFSDALELIPAVNESRASTPNASWR